MASITPTAPLAKRAAAATMSSVSIRCTGVVVAKPVTVSTGPARLSIRSSVWMPCEISTPPPSRASEPRPGSS